MAKVSAFRLHSDTAAVPGRSGLFVRYESADGERPGTFWNARFLSYKEGAGWGFTPARAGAGLDAIGNVLHGQHKETGVSRLGRSESVGDSKPGDRCTEILL